MGTVVIHTIGVIAGVLGIWGFTEEHLPKKVEPIRQNQKLSYTTTTRVVAGLDGTNGMAHAGRAIDQVVHYDNNDNGFATSRAGQRLEDGSYVDIKLTWHQGMQSVSSRIDASTDNVCVAILSTTWADGTKFGWTGDWANICRLPSYYSGIIMPNGKSPACMWLDARESQTKSSASIKIKWHDFISENGKTPSESEAKAMCGKSIKAYDRYLHEIPLPADRKVSAWTGNTKRESLPLMGRSDDSLVISSLSGQNATALCEQPNSYGPDFISLEEGIYCNMETRETLAICSSTVVGDCFDVDSTSHILKDGAHKPRIRARNPTRVIHWGSDGGKEESAV
ncbi:hypothetical protein DE146DRAFT_752900 [Phaeosphaeria sp. MPI-PUGE-AT-0046c]|nr:hypothetical protein DE146DRAFT_752900 [Phaeosphaeria sp. MPI-PUGE-AT-0046c]